MNARLNALAASLLLTVASAHAGPGDARSGKPQMTEPVKVAAVSGGESRRSHLARRLGGPDDLSPLAYEGWVVAEEGLEAPARRNAVRLYPLGGSDGSGEGAAAASAPSARAGKEIAQRLAGAKGPSLPEPGSWAMILAGFLGVAAIARRRMSA